MKLKINFLKGSHTGGLIKSEYQRVVEQFKIQDSVFKIVADSASNNKSAFKNTLEAVSAEDEYCIELARLVRSQRQADLVAAKQQRQIAILEKEIENANKPSSTQVKGEYNRIM
jgi:hypothetical protein